MIVRREFLMLTCNANLAEFRFEFVDPTTQVQSTQSSCASPQRQSWAPHMEHLEQHQGSVCLESWASCGNNPSSLSGFSSSHPGINVPSAPEDHPAKILWKTALVLSQAVQRVVILFPLWLETSQCPSLTSSVVIPAVDSLAEYEPWWSCTGAFSGLCHPQKWSICHNHHCL